MSWCPLLFNPRPWMCAFEEVALFLTLNTEFVIYSMFASTFTLMWSWTHSWQTLQSIASVPPWLVTVNSRFTKHALRVGEVEFKWSSNSKDVRRLASLEETTLEHLFLLSPIILVCLFVKAYLYAWSSDSMAKRF